MGVSRAFLPHKRSRDEYDTAVQFVHHFKNREFAIHILKMCTIVSRIIHSVLSTRTKNIFIINMVLHMING